MLAGMRRRNLGADARLSLRHDREEKPDRIDPFLEQALREPLCQRCVVLRCPRPSLRPRSAGCRRRPRRAGTSRASRSPLCVDHSSPNQDEQCLSVGDSQSLSTSLIDPSRFRREKVHYSTKNDLGLQRLKPGHQLVCIGCIAFENRVLVHSASHLREAATANVRFPPISAIRR